MYTYILYIGNDYVSTEVEKERFVRPTNLYRCQQTATEKCEEKRIVRDRL